MTPDSTTTGAMADAEALERLQAYVDRKSGPPPRSVVSWLLERHGLDQHDLACHRATIEAQASRSCDLIDENEDLHAQLAAFYVRSWPDPREACDTVSLISWRLAGLFALGPLSFIAGYCFGHG